MSRNFQSRTKLLESAITLIRTRGYAGTTVDELCAQAGVTKGAFFHHFASKEALAVASAEYWSETTSEFFSEASYHELADPLDRLLGYLDFRRSMLVEEVCEFSCLAGTMVQEAYDTSPGIRDACRRSITEHAEKLEADIALAILAYDITPSWTASSLALHIQAVLQGGFILAKANGNGEVAMACVDHLRRYVEQQFRPTRI